MKSGESKSNPEEVRVTRKQSGNTVVFTVGSWNLKELPLKIVNYKRTAVARVLTESRISGSQLFQNMRILRKGKVDAVDYVNQIMKLFQQLFERVSHDILDRNLMLSLYRSNHELMEFLGGIDIDSSKTIGSGIQVLVIIFTIASLKRDDIPDNVIAAQIWNVTKEFGIPHDAIDGMFLVL